MVAAAVETVVASLGAPNRACPPETAVAVAEVVPLRLPYHDRGTTAAVVLVVAAAGVGVAAAVVRTVPATTVGHRGVRPPRPCPCAV